METGLKGNTTDREELNEQYHAYLMKVIVIPRVRSTNGIFHFNQIQMVLFINSSRS